MVRADRKRHQRAVRLRDTHRLEENLGAARVEFTADDLKEIDRAASQIEVHGARYPEQLQKLVGR